MHDRRSLLQRLFLAAAATVIAAPAVEAQSWPARSITFVIPWAAAGSTDVAGRLLAEYVGKELGATIVVENKPGASSAIGTEYVSRQPADGYTFLVTGTNIAITAAANPSVKYDALRDFTHIGMAGQFAAAFLVNSATPYATLAEVAADIRAQPGKLNYTSPGVGSGNHILFEYFKAVQQLDIPHVSYSGSGPAVQATLGNEVPMVYNSMPGMEAHIDAGTLRLLAVSSRQRSAQYPDVPTVAEAGFPELTVEYILGLSAPAALPAEIVTRLSEALQAVVNRPELASRLQAIGITAAPLGPEAFTAIVAEEVDRWGTAVGVTQISIGN